MLRYVAIAPALGGRQVSDTGRSHRISARSRVTPEIWLRQCDAIYETDVNSSKSRQTIAKGSPGEAIAAAH